MWAYYIYETASVVLLVAIMLLLILLSTMILLGYDPLKYKKKKKRRPDPHTYESIEDPSEIGRSRITQTMKIRVCSLDSVLMEEEVELKIHIEAVPVRGQKSSKQDGNSRLETGTIPRAGPNSYIVTPEGASGRYSKSESQERPIPPPKNMGPTKMFVSPDMIKDRNLLISQGRLERDETSRLSESSICLDTPDTVGYLEPTALRKKKLAL